MDADTQPELDLARTTSRLLPLVYDRLRRTAQKLVSREAAPPSMPATALVHEAYLRVRNSESVPKWEGPSHFAAAVVEVMRRLLVETARRRRRVKHGGGLTRKPLEADAVAARDEDEADEAILALDAALVDLARANFSWAQLVKLRYFLGMTVPEAARALGVSPRTADVWSADARRWLHGRLRIDLDDVMD